MAYNPSSDAQHDAFFKWLGICITEWAAIEHVLFLLCGTVLDIDPKLVSIVYYSTPSLEGRIKLAEGLLGTLWPTKPEEHDRSELTTWKSMCKRVRDLVPERNLLAHGVLLRTFDFDSFINENDGSLFTLGIMTSRWEKLKTGKVKFIRQDIMEQHSAAVHALAEDLLAFRNQMGSAWPEKWDRRKQPKGRAKKQVHRQRRDNNVVVLDPKRR